MRVARTLHSFRADDIRQPQRVIVLHIVDIQPHEVHVVCDSGGQVYTFRRASLKSTSASNQSVELTATRRAFTFQMTKTFSLRAALALGGPPLIFFSLDPAYFAKQGMTSDASNLPEHVPALPVESEAAPPSDDPLAAQTARIWTARTSRDSRHRPDLVFKPLSAILVLVWAGDHIRHGARSATCDRRAGLEVWPSASFSAARSNS